MIKDNKDNKEHKHYRACNKGYNHRFFQICFWQAMYCFLEWKRWRSSNTEFNIIFAEFEEMKPNYITPQIDVPVLPRELHQNSPIWSLNKFPFFQMKCNLMTRVESALKPSNQPAIYIWKAIIILWVLYTRWNPFHLHHSKRFPPLFGAGPSLSRRLLTSPA